MSITVSQHGKLVARSSEYVNINIYICLLGLCMYAYVCILCISPCKCVTMYVFHWSDEVKGTVIIVHQLSKSLKKDGVLQYIGFLFGIHFGMKVTWGHDTPINHSATVELFCPSDPPRACSPHPQHTCQSPQQMRQMISIEWNMVDLSLQPRTRQWHPIQPPNPPYYAIFVFWGVDLSQ